jgi:1-aminocyclopropane-1-carboxylate deaminase
MYRPFGCEKIGFTYSDRSCQNMLHYSETPVQEIHDPIFGKAGVRVMIKREDLNHPFISGNKWWKLKYNLEEALKLGHKTLLTFGGAYSNHIYATAAAAHELGLKSIGIIRGEETLPLNNTLSFALSKGMKLHYVSRELYRTKTEQVFTDTLHKKFDDFYLIPEGGTNDLAVKGVTEFAQTLGDDFDYLCCAVGTGGTMAGLVKGLDGRKKILGFPIMKGGSFLQGKVETLLTKGSMNWELFSEYHFGGYAKSTIELATFIKSFQTRNNILLDSVYMGKLVWGVYDVMAKGYFSPGSRVLILHSGGLQGIQSP